MLRTVEGISASQQATMQRTVSHPPDTSNLQERLKSFMHNVQQLQAVSAAPATSNPSSDAMLTSNISSNTLRRDSSTFSVGRRSGGSNVTDAIWQQVRCASTLMMKEQ